MSQRIFYITALCLLFTLGILASSTPENAPLEPGRPNSTSQQFGSIDSNNKQNTTPAISTTQKSPAITPGPYTPVEQNYKNRVGTLVPAPDGTMHVLRKYNTATIPNDPYANQWWHTTTNTYNTVWQMPTPKKTTLIAIIDTGYALQHEEFTNRLYQNQGESGSVVTESASLLNCTDRSITIDASCNLIDDDVDGLVDNETGFVIYQNPSLKNCTDQTLPLDKSCNRIDDDNNGYVDDTQGWDFVNGDPSAQAGQLNPDGSNLQHGTMVMGIAAATGNNATGTAGIDWNAELLPLQAIDDDGYGDSLTVGNAIIYAANQGADVINLSLGTEYPDNYILNAVEYAYDKGSVVVAAAGNDSCNCMIYPAQYSISLSVGATDESGNKASFSSYGSYLDVVAPGVSITSTSFDISNPINSYGTGSGTSYAAPIVSGLVSLLKSQLPNASPAQLIALVTEKTNQNSTGTSLYKTTEKGYGDISLAQATNRALTPKIFTQLYKPGAVSSGGVFIGTATKDTTYFCEANALGTTPLFSATNGNTLFSAHPIDVRLAGVTGYTLQQLYSVCMVQPHDIYESARVLNIAQEFTNTSIKTLLAP